ncbi:hypothetical protein [Enterococcus sp. AZ180]|uniref:hypothetical protein n=1 Tax=Enterococcus sp. AZ180 TaxID=2774961 RepID=UPI003F1ECBBD
MKLGKKAKKYAITLSAGAIILIAGGTVFATVQHNDTANNAYKSYAKQIKENTPEKDKKYDKKTLDGFKTSLDYVSNQISKDKSGLSTWFVDKGYYAKLEKSSKQSLVSVNDKIKSIHEQEVKDQVTKVKLSLDKAGKSKDDKDIAETQKAIDGLTDKLAAKDKKTLQVNLDNLKKTIKAEKDKAAKEAKEKAEADKKAQEAQAAAAKAEQEQAAAQEAQTQAQANANASSSQGSSAASQPSYEAPSAPASSGSGSSGVIPGTNNGVGWASDAGSVPSGGVVQPQSQAPSAPSSGGSSGVIAGTNNGVGWASDASQVPPGAVIQP